MHRVIYQGIVSVALATCAAMLAATPASAVSTCKVKVDKKTGLIKVSGSFVDQSSFAWGTAAGQEIHPFFDPLCVDAGTSKAKDCTFADPTTLAAKTPPAACTVYLNDVNGPCSAWIPGCVPGARTAGRAIVGYVWAEQASNASYAPTSQYSFNSSGGTNSVTRSSAGNYTVTFPGIASTAAMPFNHVQASAYGSNTTCRVISWFAYSPPDLSVDVLCTNAAGTAVDSRYTVLVIE